MKIYSKNILDCLVFLVALLKITFADSDEECSDLIWEMRNCSSQLHIPENCDGTQQSKLLTCAEAVVDRISQCPDKIAQKMIKHFVTTYRLSDRVICQDDMHEELMENPRCAAIAKWIIVSMAYITPGFLTERGCRFFKIAFLVTALVQDKNHCFKVIENYVDMMYAKTTCSDYKVDTPSHDDAENIIDVFLHIHLCWIFHTRVPICNSTKSRRLQCVEDEILNKINNPNFKTFEKNALSVTEMTDKVMCANSQLKRDFDSNRVCLHHAKTLGGFLMAEVNGYYTEEGCEGLKYREKYKLGIIEENCRPILNTYWVEMKKMLPCVEPASSTCEKIKFSLTTLVFSFLLVFLI